MNPCGILGGRSAQANLGRSLFLAAAVVLLGLGGSGSWAPAGDTGVQRWQHAASLLADGRVLVTGGQSNPSGNVLGVAQLFQAPASWTAAASLSQARYGHTQTTLPGGTVLVTGGAIIVGDPNTGQTFEYLASAELYHPATDTWTPAASLHQARGGHTATLLSSGQVLVTGGASPTILTSVELYDPALNTWTVKSSMGWPRCLQTASLLKDGTVLVAGGFDSSEFPQATSERFSVASDSWTPTGSMVIPRTQHTATPLPDGRVLVVGGAAFSSGVHAAELFDPGTASWSPSGPMVMGPYFQSTSLLPDGRVLVAGGQDLSSGAATASDVTQFFSPATQSWSQGPSLLALRYAQTATSLEDGRVLVANGFTGSGLITSAELFTPPDTTPPVIHSITAAPSSIWPPNHKLVLVSLKVDATDDTDPHPVSRIISVSFNGSPGSGKDGPAYVITGPLTVELRAEENKGDQSRIYTITVECTDASGNVSQKAIHIPVAR